MESFRIPTKKDSLFNVDNFSRPKLRKSEFKLEILNS